MSASMYRGQLERKRGQRVDAEKKAGEFRIKESQKRSDAAKARAAAGKSSSSSTVSSKLREAERKEKEAESAGNEANRWQSRASGYAKEEASLMEKLSKAELSETQAAERKRRAAEVAAERKRRSEQQVADRAAAIAQRSMDERIDYAVSVADAAVRQLRPPKPEKLRILLLGASSEGDLRVGREQKRIRAAVESALHRDSLEIDVRPAATTQDLLDGLQQFRPHVVHFSGHSDDDLVVFEDDVDALHEGVVVSARTFARALSATDEPPLLVVLNACNSAKQIDALVAQVVPFAIGMADEISDGDAINYAAQFYAGVANGQSIASAHRMAQVRLELDGLPGAELPTLAVARDVDAEATVLVSPPATQP